MDIEFHYYMTYLIAARAGYAPGEAAIIAQSAQEIDDNHIPIRVSEDTAEGYDSVVSQTMDILRPMHNRRIYPIFHFIPGEPEAQSARRKDGLMSEWCTTPGSPLAHEMLDTALASGSLYRIGASAHAFADTWAHQNFLGIDENFNEMAGATKMERIEGVISLMRIGHALAGHQPDIPGLIWSDARLVESEVDNTARFMAAADQFYRKLAAAKTPGIAQAALDANAAALVADLAADIGPSSRTSRAFDPARIARYKTRALTAPYGATAIPDYVEGSWADAAFIEQRRDIKQRFAKLVEERLGMVGDILDFGVRMPVTWKDPAHYQETDWWKFQQAVSAHLDECWGVLKKKMPGLV